MSLRLTFLGAFLCASLLVQLEAMEQGEPSYIQKRNTKNAAIKEEVLKKFNNIECPMTSGSDSLTATLPITHSPTRSSSRFSTRARSISPPGSLRGWMSRTFTSATTKSQRIIENPQYLLQQANNLCQEAFQLITDNFLIQELGNCTRVKNFKCRRHEGIDQCTGKLGNQVFTLHTCLNMIATDI